MRLPIMLLAAIALAPTAAPAQDYAAIASARAAGQVGERHDGYLGLAGPVSETVRRQVAAVNIKRRSLYAGLAARKGVSAEEVGITAACTLLGRVAVGEAYLAGRAWQRRLSGQPAPVPTYCWAGPNGSR
ncbi:DUF1318 domain-containing protein [Sphingomonas xanthus]|uniref:DUF1318 domain-containing protein n=1 Tax=Sphingomonas xanthus TaxID=2594473 RepID=A0A516IPT2_9SPHN|nr:DUF1318 domain-containing protein [Sphingomonas xanthus]QDP18928.1 DUF1318 domain-containing protein [Sphingomonas xanthus]